MPDSRDADDGSTVGQVANRLGVTIRALRHWDEIGLAQPSWRTSAGYRLYSADDLERLQRIIVYRELGIGLESIMTLLTDAAVDATTALRTQRDLITERIEDLQQLGTGLDRMIEAHERGLLLSAAQQAAIFGPEWNPDWPAQARGRWGNTPQWAHYAERSAARGPEEWQAIADATAGLEHDLGSAMHAGVLPGSPEANSLVERHREAFAAYFPLTRQMQVCLGRKYEADPAFAAHYDGIRPGLAGWLRRSIDASASAHGIDPDTATWQ